MEVNIKELLENGVYFGHPARQFDPRIKQFLYGKRQGIYIIDIEKTAEKIKEAGEFLKQAAENNKVILFVGTKKQAEEPVKQSAEKCGMPYVNYRWVGGTLTNFSEIKKRIVRLEEIEEMEKTGKLSVYTKKEVALLLKEKEKLLKKFEGMRTLTKPPDIIVVVDVRKEINAIREAHKVGVKIVGIVDTNSNPDLVDYPIPANDDGLKSISLILSKLAECIIEGKTSIPYPEVTAEQKEEKEEKIEVETENKQSEKRATGKRHKETPDKKREEKENES
ncbi:MAG TPA: 30S ribosomal protein S2 [bacterium]|nr:30S ribosomal protein S2 [bacterium]HPP30580.1 30S ribosomal protein S2 [bacterium]